MAARCTACKRSFAQVDSAPMLFDASWAKLAHKRETLCADCFFERVRARGIKVTLADLRPCLFNCMHSPRDWFDLFAVNATAELVTDWLGWLRSSLTPAEAQNYFCDGSMKMITRTVRAGVHLQCDEHRGKTYCLQIELGNNRAITLTCSDKELPSVAVWHGRGEHSFIATDTEPRESIESFREFVAAAFA